MVMIVCSFELCVCPNSAVNSYFCFFSKGLSLSSHLTSCVVRFICPLQSICDVTVKMILQQSHLI